MSEAERGAYVEVSGRLRDAAALATALGCGFRDNHGGRLGDAHAAHGRLVAQVRALALDLCPDLVGREREREGDGEGGA